MKLCFLAAANSIHSVRWIGFFVERGHAVTWISLAPPIPEALPLIEKVSFREVRPSPLTDIHGALAPLLLPFAVRTVRSIIKEAQPDILHIHSAGTYGIVGSRAGFHPAVLTPWGSDILLTSPIKDRVLRTVVGAADLFTCDGENTRARLIALGAPPEAIRLIRFGTDVEKFKPNPMVRGQRSEVMVISLRSLEPTYDIGTLLRAAAIVAKEAPRARFLVVGDGSARARLEKLADELGLITPGTVAFLGKVHNTELPRVLQNADIYVSTALSDSGLAASTAEAMATGLPVVVTDSGDNREWVKDEGGFVVPCRDHDALAKRILELVANASLRARCGARNRNYIEAHNNYSVEMMKMEHLYAEVIARAQKNRE